jgi:type I restriction enzyme S subunit
MAVRPGHERTEIRVIPGDWQISPLSDLMNFQNGFNADKGAYGTGLPFVNVLEVIARTHLRSRDIVGRVEVPSRAVPHYVVEYGDLLFNRTSETDEELGLASVYVGDERVIFGGFVIRGRPRNRRLQATFAGYGLRASGIRKQIIARGQGAIRANIGQADLRAVLIPVPPRAEQEAIAKALSDADALIECLEKLIAKKRQIKQGAMQELLTGRKRLPGFSGQWDIWRLGDIGEVTGAGVDKKTRPGEMPVRLVNYLDVYRRDFLYSNDLTQIVSAKPEKVRRCAVRRGDVFFTPTSELPGDIAHSAVAMEDIPDGVYSYHLVRLRLRVDWDLTFRAYAFKTRIFYDAADSLCEGSGTRYVITLPRFRSMTVAVPPTASEQAAIATVLSDMDAEISALESKLAKARQIRRGMMQELLSGRIRLV